MKEADAFTCAGYDVVVIAANYIGWANDADKSFASREWRVARTLRFGPSAGLLSRTFQVMRRRSARAIMRFGAKRMGIVQAAWHPIAPDLVSAAKSIKADLYVAHYIAALPAAALAAHVNGGFCAFDAEDFHLGDYPADIAYDYERGMVRAIEAHYLPQCAYVTAASPGIADAYVRSYGIPLPTVILNVSPCASGPIAATPSGTVVPGPSVYWFSQTIGPDRGLECAVRAIGYARSRPHLYLRGTPAAGYLDHLRAVAKLVSALDRLHFLPPAPPSEMERLAAKYDVGFVGETGHTINRQIALTNKQFSYLLAGIPVVMSDTPAHRSFANGLGDAVHLYRTEDHVSLSNSLDALFSSATTVAKARAEAWRLGREQFNWEVEQQRLLRCVRHACQQELTKSPMLVLSKK